MVSIHLLGNCVLACCSAALTTLLYNYFHQEETEVLFFFGYAPICNNHYNIETTTTTLPNKECSMCNINKIIGWLNKTKKTLDICMYMFNHELLLIAILNAHKRGVIVRIILNDDNINTSWRIGSVGILKRVKKAQHVDKLMHHKFIIIDHKKVISGSLNWNIQSIRANWENAFITNNCELVNSFRQEFQRLWKQFD